MKNEYETRGDYTSIYVCRKALTLETLIDTDELPKLLEIPCFWYAYKNGNYGFVVRCTHKNNKIYLHRFIMNAPDHLLVDHVNHNTLDNRKSNLRLATTSENNQNRIGASGLSKSGIRGVRYKAGSGQWEARLQVDGKEHHVGYFNDKRKAEQAVKQARARLMPFSQEALLIKNKENK